MMNEMWLKIPGIGGGVGRWFPKDDQNEIKILEFEIEFPKKNQDFYFVEVNTLPCAWKPAFYTKKTK